VGHLLSISCSSSNPALHSDESEVSRDAICYLSAIPITHRAMDATGLVGVGSRYPRPISGLVVRMI
jgi:hypothetical protein